MSHHSSDDVEAPFAFAGPTARPAAEEETGGPSGAADATRGRRNRIRPRNWGYTLYLDKVFSLRCFEDLVRLRVFPDAKDISESYGAIQAALRHGGNTASPC